MTIPEIAILPKRCDMCGRLFWLERYSTYYKMFGNGYIKMVRCLKCKQIERRAE